MKLVESHWNIKIYEEENGWFLVSEHLGYGVIVPLANFDTLKKAQEFVKNRLKGDA